MILKNYKEIKDKFFDVVVIGSGPAGLSIALELEKKNKKCLVIEAGKDTYDELSQGFYEGKITGDDISDLSSKDPLLNNRSSTIDPKTKCSPALSSVLFCSFKKEAGELRIFFKRL